MDPVSFSLGVCSESHVCLSAEPWQPRSRKARTLWPCTKWSWWAVEEWGSRPSRSSLCMTRWETSRRDQFERVSCVWLRVSPPPGSLWRTTSPPKQTVTGRRWCWTERRSRSTSWTRRDRRTTPPYGTTTSAAARASSAFSPSQSWSRSRRRWTSGTVSTWGHLWEVVTFDDISWSPGSRSWEWRRTRTCPSSWSATSRTWTTGGRSARTRPRRAPSSGACATWRRQPRPAPTSTRYVWRRVLPAWGAAETPTISPAAHANRCSSTWCERSGRGKWRTAKRRTARRRAKVWLSGLERDAVFYSGKRGQLLMYIHISQTFALVVCPFLTVTFCSWPTGRVSVCQGVCGGSPATTSSSYLFTCWHSRYFMYFSSQLTTLQTVIISFNLGLSLRKDPRSVEKPLVMKFDVYEYVQFNCAAQRFGAGMEAGTGARID